MLSPEIKDEKELLLAVAAGDEAAFGQLLVRYGPLLKANALKVLKSEFLVEDLVQDVFLRVWLSRDRLPEVINIRAWMLQITYYQCFNVLRREKLRRETDGRMEAGEGIVQHFLPAGFDPEQYAVFTETRQLIQQAIANLSPRARQIYKLQREKGMKIAEIGMELNISPQTVKNILYKALKDIRDYMQRQGHVIPLCLLTFFLT